MIVKIIGNNVRYSISERFTFIAFEIIYSSNRTHKVIIYRKKEDYIQKDVYMWDSNQLENYPIKS